MSGCGLVIPESEPLSVDQSVADAAQLVQSFKQDIQQKKANPEIQQKKAVPDTPASEIKTPDASVQQKWFEKNWSWLAWVLLLLIFGVMWLMEKCSDRWGIPSPETMDRMSYYLTKCLPITQKAIYAALRKEYVKEKSNGE